MLVRVALEHDRRILVGVDHCLRWNPWLRLSNDRWEWKEKGLCGKGDHRLMRLASQSLLNCSWHLGWSRCIRCCLPPSSHGLVIERGGHQSEYNHSTDSTTSLRVMLRSLDGVRNYHCTLVLATRQPALVSVIIVSAWSVFVTFCSLQSFPGL
jgi:hypothetical protein